MLNVRGSTGTSDGWHLWCERHRNESRRTTHHLAVIVRPASARRISVPSLLRSKPGRRERQHPAQRGAVEPRGYREQNKRGARGSDAAQLRYRIDRSAAFRRRSSFAATTSLRHRCISFVHRHSSSCISPAPVRRRRQSPVRKGQAGGTVLRHGELDNAAWQEALTAHENVRRPVAARRHCWAAASGFFLPAGVRGLQVFLLREP
jgi:hypothetical protein